MTGALHHEGGIAFFIIALAVLAPFFLALRETEPALTREHIMTMQPVPFLDL